MNCYLTPYYVVGTFPGTFSNFFLLFLIEIFQQPCDSDTDEKTKAQRYPVISPRSHRELIECRSDQRQA